MHPSAEAPPGAVVGVHRETAPDTVCPEIDFSADVRKSIAAPTQGHLIHLAQLDGTTCKTDRLCTLLRGINHPRALFPKAIDHCRVPIGGRKVWIKVGGFEIICEG